MIITNLCYIFNKDNQVLLIYKKRGFGKGLWNGAGGKVEAKESLEESVIREVEEETGLKIIKPKYKGYLEFVWPLVPKNHNLCHLYTTNDYNGEIIETDECRSQWFDKDMIPYDKMWNDDQYWFPQLLEGKAFKKKIIFDKDSKVKNIIDL